MYDPVYELEHFGVPGMKWGVRRTPAQLGHKPKTQTPVEKWKAKQLNKIDKGYNKTYKKLAKAAEENPNDKSISTYRDKLKQQQKIDRSAIEKMTYMDVYAAKDAARKKVAGTVLSGIGAAGAASLWAARMSVAGIRIGGAAVALNVLGDMGNTVSDYLATEEGQRTLALGAKGIQAMGNAEIDGLNVFKQSVATIAPKSSLANTLSTVDFSNLKSGANYIPPEVLSRRVSELRR